MATPKHSKPTVCSINASQYTAVAKTKKSLPFDNAFLYKDRANIQSSMPCIPHNRLKS